MKKITSTRLIKLLSEPSQVTNEEMEKAYGEFHQEDAIFEYSFFLEAFNQPQK